MRASGVRAMWRPRHLAPPRGEAAFHRRYASPWLHAHYDRMASIKTSSAGTALLDLDGSGEHSLLCADYDDKLRVFSGTRQRSEHPLVDCPVAVCGFYMDEKKPRVPAVGVASGPHVFVYRNLRPFFKFTAPPVELDPNEHSIWKQAVEGEADAPTIRAMLKAAHDDGAKLSSRSLAMLPMEDEDQLAAHVERVVKFPLRQDTVITCMATMAKMVEEPDAMSSLVIGTESKRATGRHEGDSIQREWSRVDS